MAKNQAAAVSAAGPITLIAEMARGGQYCCELMFSRDGQRLVACGYDRKVHLYDLSAKKRIASNQEHSGHIDAIAMSPDSIRFATIAPQVVDRKSKGGELLFWQARDGKLLKRVAIGPPVENVRFGPLLFSPGGDELVCVIDGERPEIAVIDPDTGKQRSSIEIESRCQLAFRPDGKTLAAALNDKLLLLDFPSGRRQSVTKLASRPRGISYSPAGDFLAMTDQKSVVHLLASSEGSPLATLEEPKPDVEHVQFSADGTRLATIGVTMHGTSQAEIRIWDLKSKQVLVAFAGRTGVESPRGFPGRCALSADLQWFANAGAKTRLWQVAAGATHGE